MNQPVVVSVPGIETGDPLMTLPAISKLCEDGRVFLWMWNKQVAEIIPSHPNLVQTDAEIPPDGERVYLHAGNVAMDCAHISLDVHAGVKKYGKLYHPTVMFLKLAGFDCAEPYVQPIVELDPGFGKASAHPAHTPAYDFLIHPFSRDMRDRGWPLGDYSSFFDTLGEEYPGCTIGILGGPNDRKAWDGSMIGVRKPKVHLDYLYGYSLSDVVRLLQNCSRAIITVDSSVNRLCHAAGVRNHLLFLPQSIPAAWSDHPGCHILHAERKSDGVWLEALRLIRNGFTVNA